MANEAMRRTSAALERTHAYREAVKNSHLTGFPVTRLDAQKGDRLVSVENDLEGTVYTYLKDGEEHRDVLPSVRTTTDTITDDGAVLQVNEPDRPPKLVFIGGKAGQMRNPENGMVIDRRTYRHLPGGETGIVPVTQLTLYILPAAYHRSASLLLIHENIGASTVMQTEPLSLGIQPMWFPGIRIMDEEGIKSIGTTDSYLLPPSNGLFTPLPFSDTRGIGAKVESFGYRRPIPSLTLQLSG